MNIEIKLNIKYWL